MFLLYIISVSENMNTKSHFDWRLRFTSDRRRRESSVIVAGQDGLFQPVNYSLSHIKPHSGSVLPNASSLQSFSLSFFFFFLLPSIFSVRMKRNFSEGEKIPQVFHEDAVVYHRGSSSKHYPYIQKKQASKRPQPNPCALDVNVLNDENMYITLFLMFLKTFLSSLVADFAALEKFLLVNYLYIFIYKKK